jgi:tetratricopeptide (TPR) repeat protein
MAPNPRRRKRILIVVAAVAVLSASAFGVYTVRQSRRDAEATQCGVDGRAALAKGDYPAALYGLGRYLQRWGDRGATAEDYVLHARAMRHVEMPNGGHLLGAIAHLRKALSIDPKNPEARSDLLDLYCHTGYTTEALDLIDTMLASNPGDAKLLTMKCALLQGLRRYEPALEISMRLNELAPDDLLGHDTTLQILLASEASSKQIDDWLAKVSASHHGDPRFELLKAVAFSKRHDLDRAKQTLDAVLAASTKSSDPLFAKMLINELDASGRFVDSMIVLDRFKDGKDDDLRRERVRRLWFAGRANDVVDQMSAWSAQDVSADPEIETLYVLSLRAVNRAGDAEPLVRELAARADATGKAWTSILDWIAGAAKADRTLEAAIKAAVAVAPTSAVLWQALGDVRADFGDAETAFEAWTRSTELARSWARPYQRIAEFMMAKNQTHMAPSYARAAVDRAPNDADAIATYIKALASVADELSSKQIDVLLGAMTQLAASSQERADDVLPSQVTLLARVDKSAAEKRLVDVINSGAASSSETTLLRLARVASASGFPFEDKLLDLSESLHGVSPKLALARALSRSRKSDDATALGAFDETRRRAPADADALEWDLVRTSLLERVRPAEAGATWIRLADEHADVLRAQLAALASSAAWSDRDAIARVIERVRALTGEDGTTWQLARARWILNAPAPADSEIAAAAAMLEQVVRAAPRSASAHVMLAQAMERLGNLTRAEEQLRLASDVAPGNAWITLQLARLSQKQGRPDESLRQLDKILATGDLSPEDIEQAAYLLAVQGDARRGAELLQPSTSTARPRRQGLLLLAQLYANLGQYERAAGLCERLLGSADTQVIEMLAEAYEKLGKPADAAAALSRLDTVDAKLGERELARARHAVRWGTADAARVWYRKAVDAAPKSSEAWSALLAHEVKAGDADAVAAILDDRRATDVDAVVFVRGIRPLVGPALRDAQLKTLLVVALEDAPNRRALAESIRIVSEGWSDPGRRATIAQQVRVLADGNLRVQALQFLAADLCADAGDLRSAYEIAGRAAAQFPDSIAAARNWAQFLVRAARWEQALAAGIAWRTRSVGADPETERTIAVALLHLQRPADAVAGLEPLIAGVVARPAGNEQLLLMYMVGLVRTGRETRALELLTDLGRGRPEWRTLPLGVEAELLGDAASALTWVRMCDRVAAAEPPKARLLLARAWGGAWERYHTPELLAGANAVLTSLFSTASAAEAHVLSATLAMENGDADGARKELVEALQRDPSMVDARNNLAFILAESGQWKEAVEEANKVVLAEPKNASYRDTLANALRKGRDYDGAKKALEEAVLLEPANPAWQANLAETLAEAGRVDDARLALARFDELVASGAVAPNDAKSRMDKLRPDLR